MKINKNKRIGQIVIIVEGFLTEFEYIEEIFHRYLGYEVISNSLKDKNYKILQGKDKYSKVFIINAPTNNICSIKDKESFDDYIHFELSKLPILNIFNNQTYIIFDRDPLNNRYGITRNLLSTYNKSLKDDDTLNGLLLLSYPALESFLISLNEDNSFKTKYKLGKELKEYVKDNEYSISNLNDESIERAYQNFSNFLIIENIINSSKDLLDNKKLGLNIFDIEQVLYKKENLFYSFSQLIEILIDLQIIEINE